MILSAQPDHFSNPLETPEKSFFHTLLTGFRGRVLQAGLMTSAATVLTACAEDGENIQQLAIAVPEELEDVASEICFVSNETGDRYCDFEWGDLTDVDSSCAPNEWGVAENCVLSGGIGSGQTYSIPFTSGELSCYYIDGLPEGYKVFSRHENGEMYVLGNICFDNVLHYEGQGPKPGITIPADSYATIFFFAPVELRLEKLDVNLVISS